MQMQRGFKAIAPQLIRKRPGLSATDYARIALKSGLSASDSKDPEWSLGTTLAKEYREGRMPGIRAERVNGKLRYFPVDHPSASTTQAKGEMRIEVAVPPGMARWVDVLLESKRFGGPGEAVIWLAEEGIRSREATLAALDSRIREIRRLQESAQQLL